MELNILITIMTILLSVVIGLVGYWMRTFHKEIKDLLRQLTDYINELQQVVVSIQTHIDKGIEKDIAEHKLDIKNLYQRTGRLSNEIATLKQKTQQQ
ncbi:MAG: hypothetical protein KDD36_09250 [Flavobacteriales bacterium]|nr:hypothetical protein [Flavobacteriales bacterium]